MGTTEESRQLKAMRSLRRFVWRLFDQGTMKEIAYHETWKDVLDLVEDDWGVELGRA